jgi:tellurite resistance protein
VVLERLFGNDDDPEEPGPEVDPDPVAETSGLRRVLGQMDSLSLEERRFLAGYAYILVRVAQADLQVSEAELGAMERAVTSVGQLSEAQGVLVVELARRMNALYGATEDYALTREFARNTTPEQREDLLRAAFAVSGADEGISEAELAELNEIGMELGLTVEAVRSVQEEFGDRISKPT